MIPCYLALGSNLKHPQRQLRRAMQHISAMPGTILLRTSSLYFNKAWGRKAQPDFYNAAVAIQTRLTPRQLLAHCQAIEQEQGRYRKVRWGARTLDIDILLYGQQRIGTHNLIIPHPGLMQRDFVLTPLLEIASHECLPARHHDMNPTDPCKDPPR
ncbi:2-amino-4-hydroxy-6-hydroxymethyldihydropteridine diphosphokinase [Legionella sp. CNM-4043-24]|uniref:2-amino-4-hydroxy-6- hydroxymethyldihydropteridine diphosphokinase n=1 Tax=Legionella sp. CNM-4043-24 TaxID=3421646 RepID=UPI00403AF95A